MGYVARGGSPFSTYNGGVGVSFLLLLLILLNTRAINLSILFRDRA